MFICLTEHTLALITVDQNALTLLFTEVSWLYSHCFWVSDHQLTSKLGKCVSIDWCMQPICASEKQSLRSTFFAGLEFSIGLETTALNVKHQKRVCKLVLKVKRRPLKVWNLARAPNKHLMEAE